MALSTITVDIGTTGVKLCLFDSEAQLVSSARLVTPTVPDPAGEIYDLAALTGFVEQFARNLDPAQRALVQRISIAGVGESGGLVGPDLALASPMILWHDQRGLDYLRRLSPEDRRSIYRTTGLPVSGNYGLSKAAWTVDQLGGLTSAARSGAQWLNIAEYLAAVMSGQRWSEPSLASRTMALDLTSRNWSPEVAALVGLDVSVFPELRPADSGVPVAPAFAHRTGLSTEVGIHVAGHDHMVGAAGAGLQRGQLLNSTGTTEGVLVLTDTPRLDEHAERSKLSNGLACSGSDYTLFASIPTGGSAFATLQHLLGLSADRLGECVTRLHESYLAGQVDLGAVPLVLPQFRGSPPPTKDPKARGLIAGLRTDTGLDDIVFGCFLGMVLQFSDVLDLFDTSAGNIKVIGPASSNLLWLQLKADLLGVPLAASRFPEVVSRGAQVLAAGTVGDWDDTAPFEIAADAARHAQLQAWRAEVGKQWQHLKQYPS